MTLFRRVFISCMWQDLVDDTINFRDISGGTKIFYSLIIYFQKLRCALLMCYLWQDVISAKVFHIVTIKPYGPVKAV